MKVSELSRLVTELNTMLAGVEDPEIYVGETSGTLFQKYSVQDIKLIKTLSVNGQVNNVYIEVLKS